MGSASVYVGVCGIMVATVHLSLHVYVHLHVITAHLSVNV